MFFPGRNGPARPSAAGRSRPPGHSRPLLPGRLAKCETPCPPRNTILMCRASRSLYIGIRVPFAQPPLAMDARSVYRASRPAHTCEPHAALHHPPVHPGYHPPSRRFAAAVAALRAAAVRMRSAHAPLVPRPHGSSRRCTVFCTAQPGVYRFGPLQTSLLPCGFLSDSPVPGSGLSHPPISRVVRACPDDRRQKPQSQLLLLLTAR